jgi:hypothetical protein
MWPSKDQLLGDCGLLLLHSSELLVTALHCAVVTCALGSAARLAYRAMYRYAVQGGRIAPCLLKHLASEETLDIFGGYSEICGSGVEPLAALRSTGT